MKRFLMALLAAMALLLLCACGDKNVSSNDSIPSPSQNVEENRDENPDKPHETFQSEKNTGNDSSNVTNAANTFEALDEVIFADIEETIAYLYAKYEQLVEDVDTYDKYLENTVRFQEFYNEVLSATEQLCIRMREYSLNYAELILKSNKSFDDMYDDFEIIYDNIYDDAGDEIYDEIYDGVLDDMYDSFYDGILDDAYDNAPYREWADARSEEYGWWSDTRSDVYKKWSDFRSDVYGFWSDMRGELWDDDVERAEEKIEDFQIDIERLIKRAEKRENSESLTVEPQNTISVSNLSDIRPEFKEAMDSYEAFFDEYFDFMKQYASSDDPLGMLVDYTNYMTQYADNMSAMDEIDDSELTSEELAYYLEVTARVNQKLLGATS